ncbi:glycosyltransferase [Wohlfahrtiimonas chitiniclastica]|uniref:glycosyltransferase n=1 Tax=Wohlfahrtiimonas chitiniclastica TaxID=400946 RepID=UPI0003728337|nr:glycosyltransferase [Wohlfahrtiimonas chitiniclastica]
MQFSILCSIYYKEQSEHLSQALYSIWDAQTIHPTEIVLVKDGPLTPALDAVIAEWQLKLGDIFKVIALEKNVGLGKALNEGLTHCSYDWIFRMDTDDIAVPNRFELQIQYIKNHPDIALLGGQIAEFMGEESHITGCRMVPETTTDIAEYAKSRNPFNHPTVAMKKSVVQTVGQYQHHLLMEDYNLWLRVIAASYEVANLPDILLYMRSDGLHGRRRGWVYVQSEWQMLQLKRTLKQQCLPKALPLFIVRASVRLLPASLLQKLYKLLRKGNH